MSDVIDGGYTDFETSKPTAILTKLLNPEIFKSEKSVKYILAEITAYFISVNTQSTKLESAQDGCTERSELIEFCSDVLRCIGLKVQFDFNGGFPFIVGETPNVKGFVSDILFFGHLDTVEPGDSPLSKTSPKIDKTNGNIAGRGAIDMKAQVAALLVALCKSYHKGHFLDKSIRIILTTDEEIGNIYSIDSIFHYIGKLNVEIEPTGNSNAPAFGVNDYYAMEGTHANYHSRNIDGHNFSYSSKRPWDLNRWEKVYGYIKQVPRNVKRQVEELYGDIQTFDEEEKLLTLFDPEGYLNFNFICTFMHVMKARLAAKVLHNFNPLFIIASFAENHVKGSARHSGQEIVNINTLKNAMEFYFKIMQDQRLHGLINNYAK